MIKTGKIFFLLIVLFSCKKEQEPAFDFGYEYFPLDSGRFVIYNVDSIVYDDFTGTIDTFKYQLKEITTAFFYDLEKRPAYKVERYKRLNDTLPWEIKDVWAASRNSITAERTEENITYVKLYFPVKQGNYWNGNARNTLEPASYEYATVGTGNSFGGHSFTSTLKVIQLNKKNLIEDQYAEEVYARSIGMIYKRYKNVKTEVSGEIISGVDYSFTVNAYGIN
jgi:hypothetical protein